MTHLLLAGLFGIAMAEHSGASSAKTMTDNEMRAQVFMQISKCWKLPPINAQIAQGVSIDVKAHYKPDGTLAAATLSEESLVMMYEPTYQAVAESVLKAVQDCSPLTGLPKESYSTWSYLLLTFDTSLVK